QVICFIANLGQPENFEIIKKRALVAGAEKVYNKDLREEFIKDFVIPAIKANAIYEGKYYLATALGRPLIAKYLVKVAHKEKAQAVAHGCTGKGNDQVRLEVTTGILDSKLQIIAPLREWEFKSRDEEIEYALKNKIPIDVTKKKPYSIDMNLWGVSIEAGILENMSKEPPESCYQITRSPEKAPNKPTYVEIAFEKGVPKKINGKVYKVIDLIAKLSQLGAKNGIGRADSIENRLVGIKSREVYEAPAAHIIYLAHKELESVVLDRETMQYKEGISQKYSQLIYNGLWYSATKQALDKLIDKTQEKVTGAIRLKLYKGSCVPVGRKSSNSLYREELATYGKKDKFNQKMAEGFIKIWGMQFKS
ncbi:MAG: argininosuccinate synthase, partial [Candidatus Omnitrophota bacterium]|nr:argininosuccinate synthase [Candidatus Omnitrophota bacterium]